MEKNIIIVDKDYDRYVFVFYKDDKVVGLNFHQGLSDIDMNFNKPCTHLTELYRRLGSKYVPSELRDLSEKEKINKAIDLYTESFIFLGTLEKILSSN